MRLIYIGSLVKESPIVRGQDSRGSVGKERGVQEDEKRGCDGGDKKNDEVCSKRDEFAVSQGLRKHGESVSEGARQSVVVKENSLIRPHVDAVSEPVVR